MNKKIWIYGIIACFILVAFVIYLISWSESNLYLKNNYDEIQINNEARFSISNLHLEITPANCSMFFFCPNKGATYNFYITSITPISNDSNEKVLWVYHKDNSNSHYKLINASYEIHYGNGNNSSRIYNKTIEKHFSIRIESDGNLNLTYYCAKCNSGGLRLFRKEINNVDITLNLPHYIMEGTPYSKNFDVDAMSYNSLDKIKLANTLDKNRTTEALQFYVVVKNVRVEKIASFLIPIIIAVLIVLLTEAIGFYWRSKNQSNLQPSPQALPRALRELFAL